MEKSGNGNNNYYSNLDLLYYVDSTGDSLSQNCSVFALKTHSFFLMEINDALYAKYSDKIFIQNKKKQKTKQVKYY